MDIVKRIERLRTKQAEEGLDEDEYVSLMEYEGRLQSIQAETAYLNGEGSL